MGDLIDTAIGNFFKMIAQPFQQFAAWLLENASTPTVGTEVVKDMDALVFDTLMYNDKNIANIVNAMKGVGIAIAICFFILSFLELSQNPNLSIDLYIKHFSKLFGSIAMVIVSPQLIAFAYNISNIVATKMSLSDAEPYKLQNLRAWTDPGGFKSGEGIAILVGAIVLDVVALIIWFVIKVVNIIVICCAAVALISRTIEIVIRAIFAPIAMGMYADDGWRGNAGRYIKRLCGLFLTGPAVTVLLYAYGAVSTVLFKHMDAAISSPTGEVWALLAMALPSLILIVASAIATIGLTFRLSQIMSDVFGG